MKAWGIRDEIWFHVDDMDTEIIKGQITEWEAEVGQGKVELYAHISTARGLDVTETRLIQCKELIHLFEDEPTRVHDSDTIWSLIKEIVATPDEDNLYGDDSQGGVDQRALWAALAILFPWQVRELFLPGYKLKFFTAEYIAERLVLPVKHVKRVMSDRWPEIYYKLAHARYVPVYDPNNGSVQLYDIYMDGKWIGSQRTLEQCEDRVQFLLKSA